MKSITTATILGLVLSGSTLMAQQEKSTDVTIYNSGVGVVREIRDMDIKKGIADYEIVDVPESIDPVTVKIALKDAQILEQNYKYDLVSTEKILSKYIGKDITLVNEKGSISGKLLSTSMGGNMSISVVIQKSDGQVSIIPNAGEYQLVVGAVPEGFILYPTLVWKINSKISGKQDAELVYQTGGLNWKAEYVVMLDPSDTKLDVNSWISLDNTSGKTFKDAKLKLMAGDINRIQDNNYGTGRRNVMLMSAAKMADEEMAPVTTEKSFFEYHLYTVENPTTIANNEKKQVSMFDKYNIGCKKIFHYESSMYSSDDEDVHPDVMIKFKNSKENGLGIPLPAGNIRVYKNDGTDKELVGESSIKHTPKDEEVKIKIGEAFDVLITTKMTNQTKISKHVIENEYETEIRNRKENEDINVECEQQLWGVGYDVVSSSIAPTEKLADKIKFTVPVKKSDTTKLTYKLRITTY